jgi:type IX secretion system PorP/SprF family membrane protein
MKITGHAGANIPLVDSRFSSNEMTLSPNILFQQQGNFRQLNLGAYLKKGPIVGGLWYRNRDAFIALVGFQRGMFKFGYSYDVTISGISGSTAGSHELSLTINFDCPPDRKKFRTISCPSF